MNTNSDIFIYAVVKFRVPTDAENKTTRYSHVAYSVFFTCVEDDYTDSAHVDAPQGANSFAKKLLVI